MQLERLKFVSIVLHSLQISSKFCSCSSSITKWPLLPDPWHVAIVLSSKCSTTLEACQLFLPVCLMVTLRWSFDAGAKTFKMHGDLLIGFIVELLRYWMIWMSHCDLRFPWVLLFVGLNEIQIQFPLAKLPTDNGTRYIEICFSLGFHTKITLRR